MNKFSKEELQEIVKHCNTKADLCRALGLKPTGGNYRTVDNIIKNNEIVWDNYQGLHWKLGKKVQGYKHKSIEEICVKNSTYKSTCHLKNKLIKLGYKPNHCEICGYTENLELHHINGDPTDNRLENLQILCPNCHAKTENFRSKNTSKITKDNLSTREHTPAKELILTSEEVEKRRQLQLEHRRKSNPKPKVIRYCEVCGKELNSDQKKYCSVECYQQATKGNRPTLIQLIKDFEELKSFVQVGNKYGVTDNAVRKWCKLYGIPIHTKALHEFINNYSDPNYIIPKEEKKNRHYDPQLIIDIYKKEKSIKNTANIVGCCTDTISKVLKENNIPTYIFKHKVNQYDLDGTLINSFETITKAAQWLIFNQKVSINTNIATIIKAIKDCCKNNRKSIYSYCWKYND